MIAGLVGAFTGDLLLAIVDAMVNVNSFGLTGKLVPGCYGENGCWVLKFCGYGKT